MIWSAPRSRRTALRAAVEPPCGSGRQGWSGMAIVGIDHVQLAMPAGREDEARSFYSGILSTAPGKE